MNIKSPICFNRRQTHRMALAWAAGLSLGSVAALAQVGSSSPRFAEGATDAASGRAAHDVWRALSRLGYGPTAPTLAHLSGSDVRAWALAQVAAAHAASQQAPRLPPDLLPINDPLPRIFEGVRAERQAREQRQANAAPALPNAKNAPDRAEWLRAEPLRFGAHMAQAAASWRLMACSDPTLENPLLARMTEFWFNHFNVYAGKGSVRPFVGHYLIHVARAHALGRFEDLVLASARHPAMLHYLDQHSSVADGSRRANGAVRGLNENYARELLELHTLGVGGGYAQSDVQALARILTGWTIDPQAATGFRFAARNHDTGVKNLLGQTYGARGSVGAASSGEGEGIAAIRALVRHPSTAQRVCLRLAHFLVADEPRAALVQTLARVFMETDGDMRQVLLALLQTPDFWDPENRLFKTPMDYACSVLAATDSGREASALQAAARFLHQAGQAVHGWQTPDGYSFSAATWRVPEALTRRADFAMQMGRQKNTAFLRPFLSQHSLAVIEREAAHLQSGLMLASPQFQTK